MGEKARCEICDRNFKDAEGLAQHNAAKHSIVKKSEKKINTKKLRNWSIFIIVIGVIGVFIVWTVMGTISESRACKTAPVSEINIGGHTNLKLHIHANLRILIDNEEQFIPPNIGITTGIMRPIHTHEPDGVIHIEGLCPRDFKLGEFFEVWGRDFNSQCIFDKCVDTGDLKIIVNGGENNKFENYIMKDEDNILIEYNSR